MTTAFFRTVILYFILMIGLRLMGKRQIGELEPSELVLTLIISDLAAVPMQDFGIPLVNGVFPIVTLLCVSMLLSFVSLKSIRFRGLVCGYPMGYRSMNLETLKTDGTFTWADSAAFSGTGRLDFRWGGTVEKINWMDMTSGDYESKYFVDSYAATREEWEKALEAQDRKQDVVWYTGEEGLE